MPTCNAKACCVYAPEHLKTGEKLRNRIEHAIQSHDKLTVVLSEKSIASDWVESEVEAALELERREKRTVLFPIQLDDAVLDTSVAWAAHLRRTRHICDFTGWRDHNRYQRSFDRLLRDLRAAEPSAPEAAASAAPPEGGGVRPGDNTRATFERCKSYFD